MWFRSLTTYAFRNLADASRELSPRLNVVLGYNGAGKSSLLEALAVLATLQSFRTSSMRPLVRHGESAFRVAGLIDGNNDSPSMDQVVDVHPRVARRLSLDGAVVDVDQYLSVAPMIVFTGGDRDLVFGEPARRRSFLDRLTFLMDHVFVKTLRSYGRTLRQRNAAIEQDPQQVRSWEVELARLAGLVVHHRRETVRGLRQEFRRILQHLGPQAPSDIELEYRADFVLEDLENPQQVAQRYEMEYHRNRERDLALGFTSLGPHRHDLALTTHGRRAREVLSSGQGKLAAAALRLSAMELLEDRLEARESVPVLMDDADAELDPDAFRSLVERLGSQRQVVLSSAHPQAFPDLGGDMNVMWIEDGKVFPGKSLELTR